MFTKDIKVAQITAGKYAVIFENNKHARIVSECDSLANRDEIASKNAHKVRVQWRYFGDLVFALSHLLNITEDKNIKSVDKKFILDARGLIKELGKKNKNIV